MQPPSADPLEKLIERTLRNQPARRAPKKLQSQVLAAIEQRDTRRWWRKEFGNWPLAARAGFVVLCIALGKLALDVTPWTVGGIDTAHIASDLRSLFQGTWMLLLAGTSLAHSLPTAWVYAGLATMGTMYGLLLGVGAIAYGTLYADR